MGKTHNNEQLEPYPQALFDAVCASLPLWIRRRVDEIVKNAPARDREKVMASLDDIVARTQEFVHHELHSLLAQDVDAQRQNPLHILRVSTVFATQVLQEAGIAEASRDAFDAEALPNDVYAFGPLTWKDLSDDVHEAGISWGAWKAATVLQRRRAEGKIS